MSNFKNFSALHFSLHDLTFPPDKLLLCFLCFTFFTDTLDFIIFLISSGIYSGMKEANHQLLCPIFIPSKRRILAGVKFCSDASEMSKAFEISCFFCKPIQVKHFYLNKRYMARKILPLLQHLKLISVLC